MAERNTEAFLDVGAWDELDEDTRAVFARYMEVYAASIESVDENLGRLLDVVEDLGELENTIVIFMSDNGGTAEGGEHGTRSYFKQFIHGLRLPTDWQSDVARDIDLIGGPRAMVHYPRGWGMASNTPFRLYKGFTHAGGVRVPFLFSWPKGMTRTPADRCDANISTSPTCSRRCWNSPASSGPSSSAGPKSWRSTGEFRRVAQRPRLRQCAP